MDQSVTLIFWTGKLKHLCKFINIWKEMGKWHLMRSIDMITWGEWMKTRALEMDNSIHSKIASKRENWVKYKEIISIKFLNY